MLGFVALQIADRFQALLHALRYGKIGSGLPASKMVLCFFGKANDDKRYG